MRTKVIALLTLAALILAAIFAVSPRATLIANDTTGEVYGIDVLGLTEQAKDLPVQQYAAY